MRKIRVGFSGIRIRFENLSRMRRWRHCNGYIQTRRLRVAAGLPLTEALSREMASFRSAVKLSGGEEELTWRERDHDDLVLAVALAAWEGEAPLEPVLEELHLRGYQGMIVLEYFYGDLGWDRTRIEALFSGWRRDPSHGAAGHRNGHAEQHA